MLPVVLAVAGAGAALGLVWWPGSLPAVSVSARHLRAERMRLRRIPRARLVMGLAAVGGLVMGTLAVGPLAALGIAAVSAMCVLAVLVQVAAARSVAAAADMAQYCSSLANQSTVATTVEDALRKAAPAAAGSMADPAADLISDAEAFGVTEAANRFAKRVGTPTSRRVAAVVTVAGAGGSGWAYLAKTAQDVATQELVTQQHFQRQVASLMPQIVASVAVSVGVIALVGLTMPETGRWLQSAGGQMVLLVTGLGWAGMVGRVCGSAWRAVR